MLSNLPVLFLAALVIGLIVRWPTLGFGGALVMFVVAEAPTQPLLPVEISLGSVSVYGPDLVAAGLLTAAVRLAPTRLSMRPIVIAPAVLLFGLVVVHLLRGVLRFGVEPAVSAARPSIYFVVALAFGALAPLRATAAVRCYIAAGAAIAVLAAGRLLTSGLYEIGSYVWVDGERIDARPIVAAGALVVLQAVVLIIGSRWPASAMGVVLASGLLGAVIALQHRTVWVAATGALVVGWMFWSRRAIYRTRELFYGTTGALLLALPLALLALSQADVLRAAVNETQGDRSTLRWRFESWDALLHLYAKPAELLAGSPAGASWGRIVQGTETAVSPHNLYIELLLRHGFLALIVLAAMWLVVVRGHEIAAERLGISPATVVALIVTQLLFGLTYALGTAQGLLLGVLIGAVAFARPPVAGRT